MPPKNRQAPKTDSPRRSGLDTEATTEQRMAPQADSINALSHELRTPLSMIMAYAEFLEDDLVGVLNEQQRAFVTEIQAGAARLGRLVDDLLDLARVEAEKAYLIPTQTDLSALACKVHASMAPDAKAAGLALELAAAPGVSAEMDPQRMEQVLRILVDNAIKFTPAGGTVQLRVSRVLDEIRLAITDTGIGIPPQYQGLVFGKFYQVEPAITRPRGGAGLGLAIATGIVTAHQGTLRLESEFGSGSTFTVALPLRQPLGEAELSKRLQRVAPV